MATKAPAMRLYMKNKDEQQSHETRRSFPSAKVGIIHSCLVSERLEFPDAAPAL